MTRLYLAHPSHKAGQGPGRVFAIMQAPPKGVGIGSVPALLPSWSDVEGVKSGALSEAEFTARFTGRLDRARLVPGKLWASVRVPKEAGFRHVMTVVPVQDGDTLVCTCAVGAFCHRRVLAPLLQDVGWSVILDGSPLSPFGESP